MVLRAEASRRLRHAPQHPERPARVGHGDGLMTPAYFAGLDVRANSNVLRPFTIVTRSGEFFEFS